jgi:hypothetical protein
VNLKFVGLLRVLSGSERVLKVDDATDHVAMDNTEAGTKASSPRVAEFVNVRVEPTDECFIICPIGEIGSEERRHSDVIFGSLLEPILEDFKLRAFRANDIAEPGMITRQVIERLVRARLVIGLLPVSWTRSQANAACSSNATGLT